MLITNEYTWRKNGITLYFKNITLFILLGVKVYVVRQIDRQTGKQRQIAILTHNFFSWSYHAVLSSRPHFICSSAGGYSTGGPLWAASSVERSPGLQIVTGYKWLGPSRGYLHISFHNAHDFRWKRDCFCLFTQVRPVQRNLWLTSRSRVNMQQ